MHFWVGSHSAVRRAIQPPEQPLAENTLSAVRQTGKFSHPIINQVLLPLSLTLRTSSLVYCLLLLLLPSAKMVVRGGFVCWVARCAFLPIHHFLNFE